MAQHPELEPPKKPEKEPDERYTHEPLALPTLTFNSEDEVINWLATKIIPDMQYRDMPELCEYLKLAFTDIDPYKPTQNILIPNFIPDRQYIRDLNLWSPTDYPSLDDNYFLRVKKESDGTGKLEIMLKHKLELTHLPKKQQPFALVMVFDIPLPDWY